MKASFIAPPEPKCFLQEPFWAIHEAAFALSDTWPEKVWLNWFSGLPEDIPKTYLYLPVPPDSEFFQPEIYGPKFLRYFSEIKESIAMGELFARYVPIWPGISFILDQRDVIHWALIKGKVLPNALQVGLFFRQRTDIKQLNPHVHKVRTKVAAQVILNKNPHLKDNLQALLKEDLMLAFGTNLRPEKLTFPPEPLVRRCERSIRNDINTLFVSGGKSGRRCRNCSKQENGRQYVQKAVSTVFEINNDGIPSYQFSLFNEAVSMITEINVLEIKNITKIPHSYVVEEIMNDEILKLYLYRAPKIVVELAERLIGGIVGSHQEVLRISEFSEQFN